MMPVMRLYPKGTKVILHFPQETGRFGDFVYDEAAYTECARYVGPARFEVGKHTCRVSGPSGGINRMVWVRQITLVEEK
mgnify:CR=1 FL=1